MRRNFIECGKFYEPKRFINFAFYILCRVKISYVLIYSKMFKSFKLTQTFQIK